MSAGNIVKMLRQKHDMTQIELTEKSGITQAMASQYELGKAEPRVYTFEKMLNALGYELVVRRKKERR